MRQQRVFSIVKATQNGAWAGFTAAWAVSGAILLVETISGVQNGLFYSVIGIALGVAGGPIDSALAGFLLHVLVGTLIGAVGGFAIAICPVLAIYKITKSLAVGISIGLVAWTVLFLPLTIVTVIPALDRILVPISTNSELRTVASQATGMTALVTAGSIVFHVLYGLVYGTMMSVLIPYKSRLYKCQRCSQEFSSESKLEAHLDNVEHIYFCERCKTGFVDKNVFLMHKQKCR
jgi:DNA-directed RNA polymerase subunit RPC12/RpoP